MEDFVVDKELEFENQELCFLVEKLKGCFRNQQSNFAKLCFIIYKIVDYCSSGSVVYKSKQNKYYNSSKLLEKFGFNKKAVSRYCSCYKKFISGITFETVYVEDFFSEFSPSKLFEMLSLSYKTLVDLIDKELITPKMTCKEIRKYIKGIRATDNEEVVEDLSVEINEEEIPMVYDPKKEYEFSYFESKTKGQLLNIVWELQKEYQKLKRKEK